MAHRHAKGFGVSAAAVYDRGRPPYVPAVVEALGLQAGWRVLDLAAGTGLLFNALASAGLDVVAVEPSAAMRARLPGALEGSAEAIPLEDESVDAVAVGDGWHWFDPGAAAAEAHRVLRPGGALVLVWRWPERRLFEGEFAQRLRDLRDNHPGFRGDQGREGVDRHGGFTEWAHRTVPFSYTTDREGRVALLASASFVAALPEDERSELLAEAATLVGEGPSELDYRAEVWRTTRRTGR